MAKVIVIANEKGGAGKSTISVHLIVYLLNLGYKVASLDLDLRQKTCHRFFENRMIWANAQNITLSMPAIINVEASQASDIAIKNDEDLALTKKAIDEAGQESDYIVIDCPGADTAQSRAAHGKADIIISPMNDSFIDFDLLAKIDPITNEVTALNFYSNMVFEAKKQKLMNDRKILEWFIIRNRLATIEARNKRNVGEALNNLSRRVGFKILPGLSERVIYRELFPKGLTLLDLDKENIGVSMSFSHVAARNELRELVDCLKL